MEKGMMEKGMMEKGMMEKGMMEKGMMEQKGQSKNKKSKAQEETQNEQAIVSTNDQKQENKIQKIESKVDPNNVISVTFRGNQELTQQQQVEKLAAMRKEIESLRSGMDKVFEMVDSHRNDFGFGLNEGMMGRNHIFDDFGFFGDQIFGHHRNSPVSLIHECMTDAHNTFGVALDALAKLEQEKKRDLLLHCGEGEKTGTMEGTEKNGTEKNGTKEKTGTMEKAGTMEGTSEKTTEMTKSPKKQKKPEMKKIIPVSKVVDRGSHMLVTMLLPFAGIEDVRFRHELTEQKEPVLVVYGTQHISDELTEEFEMKFTLPYSANVKKSSATFHGEMLCITVPKLSRPAPQNLFSELNDTPFWRKGFGF